jgi:hypothetical protein
MDDYDPKADYEDHRHTSGQGGDKFTKAIDKQFVSSINLITRIGCFASK